MWFESLVNNLTMCLRLKVFDLSFWSIMCLCTPIEMIWCNFTQSIDWPCNPIEMTWADFWFRTWGCTSMWCDWCSIKKSLQGHHAKMAKQSLHVLTQPKLSWTKQSRISSNVELSMPQQENDQQLVNAIQVMSWLTEHRLVLAPTRWSWLPGWLAG